MLDLAGKACQEQTLQLFTNICKLRTKKFYNIGPWCHPWGDFSALSYIFGQRQDLTLRVEHLTGDLLWQAPALLPNVRVDCKVSQGTNTLA